ncbi:uncharacterized protein JCM10292_005253 [Rhodotorula paludigena]|uniref:uncharacterized protein n=1 Tax=Rhodotorula paludigena TaxID=86838 RepID=UPI00316C7EE0
MSLLDYLPDYCRTMDGIKHRLELSQPNAVANRGYARWRATYDKHLAEWFEADQFDHGDRAGGGSLWSLLPTYIRNDFKTEMSALAAMPDLHLTQLPPHAQSKVGAFAEEDLAEGKDSFIRRNLLRCAMLPHLMGASPIGTGGQLVSMFGPGRQSHPHITHSLGVVSLSPRQAQVYGMRTTGVSRGF